MENLHVMEPECHWQIESYEDAVAVHLPGLKRGEVKVIFNSPGILKIRGERLADGKVNFCKKIKISNNCIGNDITANFSEHDGILLLKMPKRIPLPTVSAPLQAKEEEIEKPDQQNVDDHHVPAASGTAAILSMLCKPMKCISGLQILGRETALKLGASAAVGAYVAYKLKSTC